MREIDPSHVKEASFTCSLVINSIRKKLLVVLECLKDRAFNSFTFIRHYASRDVCCGMLTKVCRACINYLKLLCFLHNLRTMT